MFRAFLCAKSDFRTFAGEREKCPKTRLCGTIPIDNVENRCHFVEMATKILCCLPKFDHVTIFDRIPQHCVLQ